MHTDIWICVYMDIYIYIYIWILGDFDIYIYIYIYTHIYIHMHEHIPALCGCVAAVCGVFVFLTNHAPGCFEHVYRQFSKCSSIRGPLVMLFKNVQSVQMTMPARRAPKWSAKRRAKSAHNTCKNLHIILFISDFIDFDVFLCNMLKKKKDTRSATTNFAKEEVLKIREGIILETLGPRVPVSLLWTR